MPEQITIWEKDPESDVTVTADRPTIDQPPLRFFFAPPHLDPNPDRTTPNFRYWNAAAALRRGTDFWGPAVIAAPGTTWFTGPVLDVNLDVGVDWNSDYDRRGLNFYRGERGLDDFIYAADSADLLCHELGHAILDIVQRRLWLNASEEAAAFHESFGDVSAILCALQVPTFRKSIFDSTGGAIYCSSPLSRLAEQFGKALHRLAPQDAESDCLRNAYNKFRYIPLEDLDPTDPSLSLTSKPHSFSRVFTGAVFEILAGMVAAHAPVTEERLQDVTFELRNIVVAAVRAAPLVPQYYASVAAKMMLAAREENENYTLIFKKVFVRRLILSLESANAILSSPTPEEDTGFAGEIAANSHLPPMSPIASDDYGLTEPLYVEMPVNPEETVARSASADEKSLTPMSAVDAAKTYVDRLLTRGVVDYAKVDAKDRKAGKYGDRRSPARMTHCIECIDNQLRLMRV